jgi:large subunit ribosomal protein L24
MTRLRKGDQVVVITGNDKGKQGKILRVSGERVVVEGINQRKKHMKRTQENQQGRIIDIECPIHHSNVKLMVEDKAVRLKARVSKKGEKELVFKQGSKLELYRPVKKPAKS